MQHTNQYGLTFAGNISKCTLPNENYFILIDILLKFVTKGPIDNMSALVRVISTNDPLDAYMRHKVNKSARFLGVPRLLGIFGMIKKKQRLRRGNTCR